ncbi:hypothetical protein D8X55_02585 [Malacoplasma penetrans]|uniref:Uncharacterized protein n=1 Tax=Malacoplasma penetrans (strain HF-2) TaxID=272633 RepID=Q8EWB9_MALP2|nr:hypothetical protein D8X55_02585 [Malacoplasma penetrans]BAC44077.1 hypothetical protein [Malacoplasma penetrans HF-2]
MFLNENIFLDIVVDKKCINTDIAIEKRTDNKTTRKKSDKLVKSKKGVIRLCKFIIFDLGLINDIHFYYYKYIE